MIRRRRSFPLLVLLVGQLSGCVAWTPVLSSPEELLQRPEPPERVRVTRTDGDQLFLYWPVMRAGAMVSTNAPGAVLVSDVRLLEVEKVSPVRTVGVLAPAALLIFLIGKGACRC